jgi:hypothetical protein
LKRFTDNMQQMVAKDGEPVTPAKQSTPTKPLAEDKKQALAVASKGMNQALDMMNASTVGLDGEFKFAGVKAGTYYVHAIYAGYIDPFDRFTDEDFASTDPAVRARIAQIPTVTVTGTDSAHAELLLERGAAISGRILFDDGSPASGWMITAIKPGTKDSAAEAASAAMKQALAMSGATQVAKSDDLGHFRITGLAADEYALRATMTAPSIGITARNIGDGDSGINLAVYTGNTFSRADAKPFAVGVGQEYGGVEIMIPSHSLHSISGHVYAKSDTHTLNVGLINLTNKNDPAVHQSAAVRDDGSFHFDYLPGGITYTLTVEGAADGKNAPATTTGFMGMNLASPEILRKYGTDTVDVSLGDSNADSISMTVAQTDWKPSEKKSDTPSVNLGGLFKGIIDAGAGDKP